VRDRYNSLTPAQRKKYNQAKTNNPLFGPVQEELNMMNIISFSQSDAQLYALLVEEYAARHNECPYPPSPESEAHLIQQVSKLRSFLANRVKNNTPPTLTAKRVLPTPEQERAAIASDSDDDENGPLDSISEEEDDGNSDSDEESVTIHMIISGDNK